MFADVSNFISRNLTGTIIYTCNTIYVSDCNESFYTYYRNILRTQKYISHVIIMNKINDLHKK